MIYISDVSLQFLFSWSSIPLVYIISFIFKRAPVAFAIVLLLFYFTAMVSTYHVFLTVYGLILIVQVAQVTLFIVTKNVLNARYILMMLPNFA